MWFGVLYKKQNKRCDIQSVWISSNINPNLYKITLNLFNLNTSTHKRSIAFTDDLIIYVTGRKTKTIRTELQELFNKISDYYYTWKLKINGSKCETILFRPKTNKIGPIKKKHCKKFQLKEKANEGDLIPHKNWLFYSRHLNSKVKILCYQTLIRTIITYLVQSCTTYQFH